MADKTNSSDIKFLDRNPPCFSENEELITNAPCNRRLHSRWHSCANASPFIDWRCAWEGFVVVVELVRDHETLEPASTETERLLDLMRNNGVLISNEGFNDNVLKIRPPMVFRSKHADILIEALNKLFAAF